MQDSAKMTAMRGRDEQRWLLHGGSRDADTNDDVSSSSESRASRRRCASMSCVSAAGCGGLWRRRKAGGGAGGGRSVLSLLGLAAVVFYEVSGGPFGSEDAVAAGGPLLALAGFIVMPMVWSVPEAFVVAELATAMPENAGYAAWVSEAFGSFWGFQEGYWSWVSGVTDNAVYPLLFLLYLCGDCDDDALGEYEDIVSSLLRRPMFRWIFLVLTILMLTFINHRGIHIVGRTSVALAGFTLLPFIILVMLGIPKVVPSRWLNGPVFGQRLTVSQLTNGDIKWRRLVNVLFWNLNYFDSASTLAGEVDKPETSFPRALFIAVVIVVLNYVLPLAIGIGITSALPVSPSGTMTWATWGDGSLVWVAKVLGGSTLRVWVVAAAAVSNIGLFLAEMSSDSYQLAGMAQRGMLPAIFNRRSRYGTPTVSIMLSALGVIIIGTTPLESVVETLNFLYCLAALLEFAAFIKLRISRPDMPRPYRVPVSTLGAIFMLSLPSVFIILVLLLASMRTVLFCSLVVVVGFFLPTLVDHAKRHRWCEFVDKNGSTATCTAEIVDDGCSPHGSEHDDEEEEEGGGEHRNGDTLLPR